jgi:spore coat polysaccharide biosynthesis protein SpsF
MRVYSSGLKLSEPLSVVAIIQARTGSTRLPGKVLMDISGKPMLTRVLERTKRAKLVRDVVVATTINHVDDPISHLCQAGGWPSFRGSEEDVLDRYFQAAQAYHVDLVVRITSDCPLVDPDLVDLIVQTFLDDRRFDYVSNTLSRSFPRGLDVEVITFSALSKAWEQDKNPRLREHVTQYIVRHPEMFKLHGVRNSEDYSAMRWTVDTNEDLEFVRTIFAYFGHDRFTWLDVLSAIREHPQWLEINRHIAQKPEPL